MPCRRLLTDLLLLEAGRFSLLPPEVGGSDCITARSLGGKQEQATAAKFALAKSRTGRHVRKATEMVTAGQGHDPGPRCTQDQRRLVSLAQLDKEGEAIRSQSARAQAMTTAAPARKAAQHCNTPEVETFGGLGLWENGSC